MQCHGSLNLWIDVVTFPQDSLENDAQKFSQIGFFEIQRNAVFADYDVRLSTAGRLNKRATAKNDGGLLRRGHSVCRFIT